MDSGDIDETSDLAPESTPADDLPKLDMELTSLKVSYKFWVSTLPNGIMRKKSGKNDVLHHYGFSDEAIAIDNEIIVWMFLQVRTKRQNCL